MAAMSAHSAYPLSWPPGWPRAAAQLRSAFAERTVFAAVEEVQRQLELTKCTQLVISSNVTLGSKPKDKGVCVYFQLRARPYALPCDKWDRVEDNLWAISKHVESLRLQERWGVGSIERAFAGYLALPWTGAGDEDWWTVLGVDRAASLTAITAAFKDKARLYHPDAGGAHESMAAINRAFAEAKSERGNAV